MRTEPQARPETPDLPGEPGSPASASTPGSPDAALYAALRCRDQFHLPNALEDLFEHHPWLENAVVQTLRASALLPARRSIETAADAIAREGRDDVWKLSVGLSAEFASRGRLNEPRRQDDALRVLLSGWIARELVRSEASFDPQLGFTCALLRNHGRLLMHWLLSTTPTEVQRRLGTLADEERLQQTFGISPTELGSHLLSAGLLPTLLQDVLATLPGYLVTTCRFCHEDELILWTDLAMALASSIPTGESPCQTFCRRIGWLLEDPSTPQGLDERKLLQITREAVRRVLAFELSHPASFTGSALASRMKSLVQEEAPEPAWQAARPGALQGSDRWENSAPSQVSH